MSDFSQIYYGARQTCLEMLRDRNYKVPENLFQLTKKEFEIMFEKRQMDLYGITDVENKPIYVKFVEPARLFNKEADRVTIFKEIAKYFNSIGMSEITDEKTLDEALNGGLIRLIIIYNSRQLGQLQTKYEEKYITHPYIEIYQVHNMNISVIKNKYQPKWRLISDPTEQAQVYRRYEAKPIMIGSVCIDDPVNRYYGGRPAENGKIAQIYEITRNGLNIYYRKVVSKRMNLK